MFIDFIADKCSDREEAVKLFEDYHRLLTEANKRVNLISRKIDPNKIWTFHFYDSLLPLAYNISFSDKKVLDLGTGGGLPGIPLAIMNPDVTMHLLDSRGKKVAEIERMIKKLDLNNCSAICNRLEELGDVGGKLLASDIGEYDIIVSRSVMMTRSLIKKAISLLSEEGYLLLYKAKEPEEDLRKFDCQIYDDYQLPWGERKLIKVKGSLQ